jgi:hypothetical protein
LERIELGDSRLRVEGAEDNSASSIEFINERSSTDRARSRVNVGQLIPHPVDLSQGLSLSNAWTSG